MNIDKKKHKTTNFGKNLKFLRRFHVLSQTKLAVEIGVNRNQVASYETGIVEPRFQTILKVSKFFRVGVKNLLATDLSLKPIALIAETDEEADAVSQLLIDRLEEFTKQTNEMSKVYDGYTTLLEIRSMDRKGETSPLTTTLEELLELLRMLVSINWKLINASLEVNETKQ